MENETTETIKVKQNTKLEFDKDQFAVRVKQNRFISADEFMLMLIKHWRSK